MEGKFMSYNVLQNDLIKAIDQKVEPIENVLQLNWNNSAPQNRANQLAMKLGNPHRIDQNSGGVVIWRNVDPFFRGSDPDPLLKSTKVYSKLMIKDEQIPHVVPLPHTDWFYAYVYMDVSDDKVEDVRALTESVGYDTMSKETVSRCHFMPADLTTLYLAKLIAQGHKSLAHAMQEYVVLIPTLAEEEKKGGGLLNEYPGPWHISLTKYLFDLGHD